MERRAWGGAVVPRGRSEHGRSCSGGFGGDKVSAQGWSLELDAVSAVHDAVQCRVGQGGISDDLVPAADRDWLVISSEPRS